MIRIFEPLTDLLRAVVQRLRDQRAAEVRHVVVDLARELDEARREVELARLPREVEGIDRDAVAAEAGAWLERREAERLRRRRVDHFPDVDVHAVAELRELVDERDVDGAVDVLEQLRQLGRVGRRDLVHRVDRLAVDLGGGGRCSPALIPPTTFGVVFVVQSSRPGSTRSGDIARWKSSPAFRPEPSSRIGCRISRVVPGHVVDSRTTTWPRWSTAPGCARALSMYERSGSRCRESGVGSAIRIACACLTLLVVDRRDDEALLGQRRQALRADVLDVALAAVQRLDDVLLHVDEQHAVAGLRRRWLRAGHRRSRRRSTATS